MKPYFNAADCAKVITGSLLTVILIQFINSGRNQSAIETQKVMQAMHEQIGRTESHALSKAECPPCESCDKDLAAILEFQAMSQAKLGNLTKVHAKSQALAKQSATKDSGLSKSPESTNLSPHVFPTPSAVGDTCNVPENYKFYSQTGEDRALYRQFFCGVKNATYVEIGALDGVTFSNTKFYEDSLGWSGVLIEAQPQNAARLKTNRPDSKTFALAVCPEGLDRLTFTGTAGAVAGATESMTKRFRAVYHGGGDSLSYSVDCKPMSTILRNAGVTQVDLFSLDVEGAELKVLETMDWGIPVYVWLIELDGMDKVKDQAVRDMLLRKGYTKSGWDVRTGCTPGSDCASNEVFVHKDYEKVKRIEKVNLVQV